MVRRFQSPAGAGGEAFQPWALAAVAAEAVAPALKPCAGSTSDFEIWCRVQQGDGVDMDLERRPLLRRLPANLQNVELSIDYDALTPAGFIRLLNDD
jgi:hypothetical protein